MRAYDSTPATQINADLKFLEDEGLVRRSQFKPYKWKAVDVETQ